ncbi:hypothetical protein GE107_04680 [Cohnella sp. CFH 77786]|uniref:hypothetical protein n=1 Tax=Cohnella sp. CFH 77786 TaxID=2662265 RepID=UPI001C6105FE|nr:hypothetical protein [Cohnella sp. CFH 77786]MBW5445356.1 hypothetical protein [Cohnella sp. CFH 77786]
MILTNDVTAKIDRLTRQNETFMKEINQIKSMLQSDQSQSDMQSSEENNQQSNQQYNLQNDQQNNQQNNQQNDQQNNQQNDQQYNQPYSLQNDQQSGQQNQLDQLAGDLLKVKDMIQSVESGMSQYVRSQTSGHLTEKDVAQLILTVMDGMITWASDYVSSHLQTQSSE